MTEPPAVVALYGATALGKTDIAVALAELLVADVVVADSMQAYAGLPIVTNQPDERQRARVRHHLVGFVPPREELTVARFAECAHAVLDRLATEGRPAIVEGGSGLYLRAALGNLELAPRADESVRLALEERWDQEPTDVIAELTRLDPEAALRVDTRNSRRVIRALEAVLVRGAPTGEASRAQLWQPGERYAHRLFALAPEDDRSSLRARIDARVDEMLSAGALEEVAAARAAGPLSRTAMQAIGVRELCAVLDGELALPEAAARMKARTRALARRQLTWMRKLPVSGVVPVAGRTPAEIAAQIFRLAQKEP